jgi:hypothetical protein
LTQQQQTTRGLSAKRMKMGGTKMGDGHGKPPSELHLNTSCCMETGFDCVGGESPAAAAAKLCSGMDLVLSLLAIMTSILNIQHLVSQ